MAGKPTPNGVVSLSVSLVALAMSIGIVYPAVSEHAQLSETLSQREADLRDLARTTDLPPGSLTAAAKDGPTEPSAFLKEISGIAVKERCKLAGLEDNAPTPGGKDEKPTNTAVRPLRARVKVVGTYPAIRGFIRRLGAAQRAYAVADLSITLQRKAGVKASTGPEAAQPEAMITIERYVVARGGASAAPSAAPAPKPQLSTVSAPTVKMPWNSLPTEK